jgi:hypothetical protein
VHFYPSDEDLSLGTPVSRSIGPVQISLGRCGGTSPDGTRGDGRRDGPDKCGRML